jgi:hypothetical protein
MTLRDTCGEYFSKFGIATNEESCFTGMMGFVFCICTAQYHIQGKLCSLMKIVIKSFPWLSDTRLFSLLFTYLHGCTDFRLKDIDIIFI